MKLITFFNDSKNHNLNLVVINETYSTWAPLFWMYNKISYFPNGLDQSIHYVQLIPKASLNHPNKIDEFDLLYRIIFSLLDKSKCFTNLGWPPKSYIIKTDKISTETLNFV